MRTTKPSSIEGGFFMRGAVGAGIDPAQGKLVQHPKDWPWSSSSFYEKGEEGLIRIDPAAPGSGERDKRKTAPLNTKGCGTRDRLGLSLCATAHWVDHGG